MMTMKKNYAIYYYGLRTFHDVYHHPNMTENQIIKLAKREGTILGAKEFTINEIRKNENNPFPIAHYKKRFTKWYKMW